MDPPIRTGPFSHAFMKVTWKHTLLLSFQSLGVIFGQIGTAPLYVFGTIHTEVVDSEDDVYELFSFTFWSLTIIALLKYAFIVMRADDNGEGGIFALYSILCRHAGVGLVPNGSSDNEVMDYEEQITPTKSIVKSRARRAIEKNKTSHYFVLFLALLGCCFAIGDAVLTPSISMLSAASGVRRSLSDISTAFSSSTATRNSLSRALEHVQVPSACVILVCLFMLQHYGTHRIGFLFAPIVTTWLLMISGLGIYNIFHWNPKIVHAISPTYMYRFLRNVKIDRWRSLGSIILCVTGSEAIFADLGHFSKASIKITFVCFVYPVLVLCYAGQAAYMSKNFVVQDFNHLSKSVPCFSLLASAVGSQGTITATFSIINQCHALGCFPRVKVIRTSDKIHGQIYIPDINWLFMIFSLATIIGFRDIVKIGNATGLAIISGMLVTTSLMSFVIALYWEKNVLISICFLFFFGSVEIAYLTSCLLNFHKGAWYLVCLLALSFTVMLSWHYGTVKKYEFNLENKVPTECLTELIPSLGVSRLPGIGFIYTDIVTGIPTFFSHFITNISTFHQVLIFVSFKPLPVPYVPSSKRYLIGRIGHKYYKIYRCIARYGYRDHITDTDNFEDEIICSIGEFISKEEIDNEYLTSPEGRMIIVGEPSLEGTTSISTNDTNTIEQSGSCEEGCSPVTRKRVRFMLPANGSKMGMGVREELQGLVDARESGATYFLGRTHLNVRDGSNFLKQFSVMTYVFLDKICRQPPVALNIPHAALLEVGMIYTI